MQVNLLLTFTKRIISLIYFVNKVKNNAFNTDSEITVTVTNNMEIYDLLSTSSENINYRICSGFSGSPKGMITDTVKSENLQTQQMAERIFISDYPDSESDSLSNQTTESLELVEEKKPKNFYQQNVERMKNIVDNRLSFIKSKAPLFTEQKNLKMKSKKSAISLLPYLKAKNNRNAKTPNLEKDDTFAKYKSLQNVKMGANNDISIKNTNSQQEGEKPTFDIDNNSQIYVVRSLKLNELQNATMLMEGFSLAERKKNYGINQKANQHAEKIAVETLKGLIKQEKNPRKDFEGCVSDNDYSGKKKYNLKRYTRSAREMRELKFKQRASYDDASSETSLDSYMNDSCRSSLNSIDSIGESIYLGD